MMQSLFLVSMCFIACSAMDPDVGKNMTEIVLSKGFPIEEYAVQTQDGYILGLFRIPHGRAGVTNATGPKPAVLLQHGLLDSSFTWVNNFADQSLAFLLADQGFDVWLGNNRGTTYSKKHCCVPVDSDAFWDFTWDEMAKFDLPAMVDFILDHTGFQQISYIGHSEGTIQAFAGFSINSDLSSKINWFGALAPVAFDSHMTSPLLDLLIDFDVDKWVQLFGIRQFLPDPSIIQQLAPELCDKIPHGCDDILFLVVGYGNNLNESRIEVYVSQTPAGTSVRNMVHWAQGARQKKFQMYDFGCELFNCANLQHYGQRTPPQYNLSAITVPTALYYSDADTLADPTDVNVILQSLPVATLRHTEHMKTFNHLDFTWGADANKLLYVDVIQQLQKLYSMDGPSTK